MRDEWITWDDAFIFGGGMSIGALLGLLFPTWLVALSPVWVLTAWLIWQFVRNRA